MNYKEFKEHPVNLMARGLFYKQDGRKFMTEEDLSIGLYKAYLAGYSGCFKIWQQSALENHPAEEWFNCNIEE